MIRFQANDYGSFAMGGSLVKEAFVRIPHGGEAPFMAHHVVRKNDATLAVFEVGQVMVLPGKLLKTRRGAKKRARQIARKLARFVPPEIYGGDAIEVDGKYASVAYIRECVQQYAERIRWVAWEEGGFDPATQMGSAQVVTNSHGLRLRPQGIRSKGRDLPNGRHAVFGVYPDRDMVLIHALVWGKTSEYTIISKIVYPEGGEPRLSLIWAGEDIREAPAQFFRAASAALDKAWTPNCTQPIWII